MGIFGNQVKLNDAKVSGGGVYFTTGQYVVEIEAMKIVQTRQKKDLFVLETKILESTAPDRSPGTHCNWAVTLDLDAAPGNIKALLCAASGLDANGATDAAAIAAEDWDAVAELAVGDKNPFKGDKIRINAIMKLKKNRKPDPNKTPATDDAYFTLCIFSPVKSEEKAA